jgi:hypothetical protein
MDCSVSLVTLSLNTFPIRLTLAADAHIRLLRTETLWTCIALNILLTRRAHLMLLHERQKCGATDIARLEKMSAIRLLQAL